MLPLVDVFLIIAALNAVDHEVKRVTACYVCAGGNLVMDSRFYDKLPRTWMDSNGSLSPMRVDVKEKFFPFPSEGRWMWRFASSPISDLERLWFRDVLQTTKAVGGFYSTVS